MGHWEWMSMENEIGMRLEIGGWVWGKEDEVCWIININIINR